MTQIMQVQVNIEPFLLASRFDGTIFCVALQLSGRIAKLHACTGTKWYKTSLEEFCRTLQKLS